MLWSGLVNNKQLEKCMWSVCCSGLIILYSPHYKAGSLILHLRSVNKCHIHTYFLNHSQYLCKIPNSVNVASTVPYREPTRAYKCNLPLRRQFQSLSWRHLRAGKHSGSSFLIWQHHCKNRREGGGCRSIFSSCLEGVLVLWVLSKPVQEHVLEPVPRHN